MDKNYNLACDIRGTVVSKCDAIITHVEYLLYFLQDVNHLDKYYEEQLNKVINIMNDIRNK